MKQDLGYSQQDNIFNKLKKNYTPNLMSYIILEKRKGEIYTMIIPADLNGFKVIDVRNKIKSNGKYQSRSITRITDISIHHSMTSSGSSASYADYHVNKNKWAGIGYHFVISPQGIIEYCGDLYTIRAAVLNYNANMIGICLTGDFRKQSGSKKPTAIQLKASYEIIKFLKSKIPTIKNIKGHREYPGSTYKECPGFDMNEYRTNLNNYINSNHSNSNTSIDSNKSNIINTDKEVTIGTVIKDNNQINIYKLPDISSEVTGALIVGKDIKILGEEGDFYKVFLGYVPKSLIGNIKKEKLMNNSKSGKVNAPVGLNVRSEPKIGNNIVTKLNHGSYIEILSEEGEWYKIPLGYVHKNYIIIENQDIPIPDKTEAIPNTSVKANPIYELVGSTHVIRVKPEFINIMLANKIPNNLSNINTFINGTFFWQGQPNGILIDSGVIICDPASHAWRGFKQSVLYCDKDNKVHIGKFITANELNAKNIKWAIGGLGLSPDYNPSSEGFTGAYSDVLRTTNKTIIGYDESKNDIILAVRPNTSHDRLLKSVKNLNLSKAISLDGGGSSCMKFQGSIKMNTSRKINNYIIIK